MWLKKLGHAQTSTLTMILTFFLFCQISNSFSEDITMEYSPKIIEHKQIPLYPNSNSPVHIYTKIFDQYGRNANATLNYTIDNGTSWIKQKMDLINGIPTNGTYVGIIPIQKENTTVMYGIFFTDDLGYYLEYSGRYIVKDLRILEVGLLNEPKPDQPVSIYTNIQDNNNNINNVTLYYSNYTEFNGYINPNFPIKNNINFTGIKMDLVNKEDAKQYLKDIPPLPVNTSVAYYIEANYKENNIEKSLISDYRIYPPFSAYRWCVDDANKINITSKIHELNINELTANLQFRISGYLVNSSLFLFQDDRSYPGYYFKPIGPQSDSYRYGGYLEGISISDRQVNDIFDLALSQEKSTDECNPVYRSIQNANSTGFDIVSIPLSGNPLAFPFDHYYLNLILNVPYRNITFSHIDDHSNLLDSGFSYSSIIENNTSLDDFNPDCKIIEINRTLLCTKDIKIGSSFIDIKYNFDRSYYIFIVIIPIIAIFYLLGGIFVFENALENIGNRLTLTLGIFALIFTLPEIITSMKPLTSAPTIADSMLSIIIIATIAFTVSSILSSSSTIQKWFPKHHTWIDGIVFVIVAGFVIAYFNNYIFDNEIWWLVPIIIFGLGYGLLLRVLGVRINKPLIHFFRVTKKKDV